MGTAPSDLRRDVLKNDPKTRRRQKQVCQFNPLLLPECTQRGGGERSGSKKGGDLNIGRQRRRGLTRRVSGFRA